MKKQITLALLPFAMTLSAIELPSIMVESSKLEDTLLESPSTIDLLDKKKIEISNIKNIKDLSAVVPNTNISGLGNRTDRTFSIRGITNYVAYESSVAMYIDDTPVPFSYGFGMVDMSNVESIEVLKGAQGTLFGKNAESAVINIYTKAPSKIFKSKASVDYSSYNTKEFYGAVSGPTSNEEITYALSVTKGSSDGFSKNEITNSNFDYKNFLSLSTKLRYNPNSPLDISLKYSKSKSDDGASAYKINTKDNPFSIDNDPQNGYVKMDADLLSLIVKYKESDYTFTSATTYAKESVLKDMYVPIMGGLNLNFDIDITEITQELRLKQNFDDGDLLVGAFYSDKLKFDYKEDQTLLAVNLNSLNSLENPDRNMALFSQYRYYFDDYYSLMAGLRYQKTERSFSRDLNNFGAPTTHVSSATSWTHILPTISLSYLGDDNSNTYLTYSQGYRPGGYNYRTSSALVPFEPEKTDSFELGYKNAYNKTLLLNSAVFYNIITDNRINTFNDTLSTTTLNASKADSYGLEFDVSYKKDALNLYSTFGLTRAKIKNFNSTGQYDGKTLIDVPDMTASLGAKYNLNKNFYVRSDLKYMGERYYNIQNTAKEDGYTLTAIAAGFEKNSWKYELYADNVFDTRYVDFMIYTPTNNYYHFGAPRVIGVKVSGSF
ncbi:MAG: TonB-dependent receptor [Helicobacteraceae bacterium]|nr:TonB-dependent receptor [Helicobacteraceae bacterium]